MRSEGCVCPCVRPLPRIHSCQPYRFWWDSTDNLQTTVPPPRPNALLHRLARSISAHVRRAGLVECVCARTWTRPGGSGRVMIYLVPSPFFAGAKKRFSRKWAGNGASHDAARVSARVYRGLLATHTHAHLLKITTAVHSSYHNVIINNYM